MTGVLLMPELIGLQDAASLLLEAISAARINRQQSKYRTKLRRVLRRMWAVQRGRLDARWLPRLKASGLLREAYTQEEMLVLLGSLLAEDEAGWGEQLAIVLTEVVMTAARAAITDLKITTGFDIPTQRIEDEIRRHAAELVKGLNDTTRADLKRILERAVADQLSYTETAKLLRNRFSEFGTLVPLHHIRDRAELIAVTEVGQAYVRGQQQIGNALTDLGIAMEKAWLTAADDRVEAECEENGAAGWISWEETFPSGHDAPLAHVGCRCALQMQRSEAA